MCVRVGEDAHAFRAVGYRWGAFVVFCRAFIFLRERWRDNFGDQSVLQDFFALARGFTITKEGHV